MSEFQKTIKQEFRLSGVGLHTGCRTELVFKPAKENSGINFIRVDLRERPMIKVGPSVAPMDGTVSRCTTIGPQDFSIRTVEHLLSVLCGLGIDNLTIEINNEELPGLDGSGLEFLKAIKKAGIVEQKTFKEIFEIREPLGVERNGCAIYLFPSPELKISYALDYDHPFLRSQFLSLTITSDTFEKEIAPCRTFCLEKEASELRTMGLGKGATHQNTLVVGEKGVKDNTLRFPDEFVRHKILDFIGDLYLLGMPIRAQVFAVKSGHGLNMELLKKIVQQKEKYQKKQPNSGCDFSGKKVFDISDIMKILPHRYPFLLVDRVIILEEGKKAIGIKNVTMNDYYFQGHFPSRAVMPGVIMVEAMAQAAGVVVLTNPSHRGQLAFFLSADKVKFRRVVVPGDQFMMEVDIIRDRSKTVQVHVQAKVEDEVAAEADLVFSFTDSSYLD